MGKSNRIRVKRVDTKVSAPKKKQQGMPSWAVTLIAVAITVAIICSAALLIMSSNGVFGRMRIAMRSDDYKVNQNTFSYFFNTVYTSFQTEYESSMSSFSLDTSKPLKDQPYGGSGSGYAYETYYLGEFEGTWYDYFMEQTKSQVKTTLIYCEAADELGISLDDEDMASIDSSVASIETQASLYAAYGYTVDTYLAETYGTGVSVKDIRKGLELSALATKCSNAIAEQVEDAVNDDMIASEYDDNKVGYDLIDYMMYTVSVKYDDAVKEVLGDEYNENYTLTEEQETEVKEKYIELIAKAETFANELAEIDNDVDFYSTVINHMLGEAYDEAYEKVDFADEEDPIPEPSDEAKKTIKEKTIASIIAAFQANKDKDSVVIEGDAAKDEETEKWMLYGIEVDTEYATELNIIYKNLYANFAEDEDTLTKEGVSFSESNDFILGAFKDLVVDEGSDSDIEKIDVNGTKVLFAGDEDLEEQDDDYVMYEYYNANVYMLTKAPYQDTDHAKNLSYILSTNKSIANNIIYSLKQMEAVDAEAFADIVEDEEFSENAYHYTYENYTKGTFGVAAFDNWIFAKGLKPGSFSTDVITMDESTENGSTTGTYCVAFFDEDGDENWYVAAKAAVLNELYQEKNAELEAAHSVEMNDKVIAKVDA